MGPRGKKSIFVRYPEVSKGYVFIGEQENNTVIEFESRDVVFIENEFSKLGDVGQDFTLYETQEMDTQRLLHSSGRNLEEEDNDLLLLIDTNVHDLELSGSMIPDSSGSMEFEPSGSIPNYDEYMRHVYQDSDLRRSQRKSNIPKRYRSDGISQALLVDLQEDNEPKNVSEAFSCPAKGEWIKAMEEEMASMRSNHVWELVDLPKGHKTIGDKWVLKIKRKADGSIKRYKARLVAKGYTQQ